MNNPGLEALSEGLWQRLRDVILAERRLEHFAFAPETAGAGAPGRLSALAGDAEARRRLGRDVALRALGAASDTVNFGILEGLAAAERVTLEALAAQLGLPALAVAERIHALAQAGLAAREVERGAARATVAGQGLVSLVEALGAALGDRLNRELPGLLAS